MMRRAYTALMLVSLFSLPAYAEEIRELGLQVEVVQEVSAKVGEAGEVTFTAVMQTIKIVGVACNSPAADAELQVGEEIVGVAGIFIGGLPVTTASKLLLDKVDKKQLLILVGKGFSRRETSLLVGGNGKAADGEKTVAKQPHDDKYDKDYKCGEGSV